MPRGHAFFPHPVPKDAGSSAPSPRRHIGRAAAGMLGPPYPFVPFARDKMMDIRMSIYFTLAYTIVDRDGWVRPC